MMKILLNVIFVCLVMGEEIEKPIPSLPELKFHILPPLPIIELPDLPPVPRLSQIPSLHRTPLLPDISEIRKILNLPDPSESTEEPSTIPSIHQRLTGKIMDGKNAADPSKIIDENYLQKIMEIYSSGTPEFDIMAARRLIKGALNDYYENESSGDVVQHPIPVMVSETKLSKPLQDELERIIDLLIQ